MLTEEKFKELPRGKIFATGILPNSSERLFIARDGGDLKWVAIKGWGYDWAIYCHWSYNSEEWIMQHGDKIHNENYIKKCVPCEDSVFKLYRY